MLTPILQWNCRGYYANYEELLTIIRLQQPLVLCLQELHLYHRPFHPPPQFSTPLVSEAPGSLERTGAALIFHSSLPHKPIPLTTSLQATAARVLSDPSFTICSLYLPPSIRYTSRDLLLLLQQLPPPLILTGDLNMKNPLWGDPAPSPSSLPFIPLLSQFHLSCLNNGLPTYENIHTLTSSCLDVTFISTTHLPIFSWTRLPHLYGSDHYPSIITSSLNRSSPSPTRRWQYHKANWPAFLQATYLTTSPLHSSLQTIDDAYRLFQTTLLTAATNHIPQSIPSSRPQTPWWTATCSRVHTRKHRLYTTYKRSPTNYNLIAYKAANAHCRRTLRQTRRAYFRQYVTSVTSSTPHHQIFRTVYNISHHRPPPITYAIQYGPDPQDIISSPGPVADILGYTFATHSNSSQYPPSFRTLYSRSSPPDFHSPTSPLLPYNRLFTRTELQVALQSTNNGAPGPDGISLPMILHSHPRTLSYLLDLINRAWFQSRLPTIWTTATVIPIPKPHKDPSNPKHHRPIALTPIPSKLMERMVSNRLIPLLENTSALTPFQFGFRKNCSTTDPLLRFDHDIRHSFAQQHSTLAAFLDIEHAYDSTWRNGILIKLCSLGFRGNLPLYLQALMSNRTMRVNCNNTLSRYFILEEGVPQGGVLSGTLFTLAINDISLQIPPTVRFSLYADDLLLYTSGHSSPYLERQLQLALNACSTWGSCHGFSFSPTKSSVLHFTRPWTRHSPHQPPFTLHIANTPIPVRHQHRFLGLTFDSHLTYRPHITTLKASCLRLLDLLSHIAGKSWGANRNLLLRLYFTLIRSRLDYACVIFTQTSPSITSLLDPVQNRALRIATGAFRSSPSPGLHLLTAVPPLTFHFSQISSRTYLRLLRRHPSPLSPLLDTIPHPPVYWPFANTVHHTFTSLHLPLSQVLPYHPAPTHLPWLLPPPDICTTVSSFPKNTTPPQVLRSTFLAHAYTCHPTPHVYTDGSKTPTAVGASVVFPDSSYSVSLPKHASNYTAELAAILLALHIITDLGQSPTYTIFSDSLSSLQAIRNIYHPHPLVTAILSYLTRLHTRHKSITFCWVPAHANIPGNEHADRLARLTFSHSFPPPSLPPLFPSSSIPASDFYPYLKRGFHRELTHQWSDNTTLHHLHLLFPTVPLTAPPLLPNRFYDVVRTRLVLGHTALTHGHLMTRSPALPCPHCATPPPLSISHILFECPSLDSTRRTCFSRPPSQPFADFQRQLLFSPQHFPSVIKFLTLTATLYKI